MVSLSLKPARVADGTSVPARATIKLVRSTPATGTPAAPGDLSGSLAGFGLMLPSFDPYRQGGWRLLEAAGRAEELGFDSGWAGDHLQYHAPVLEPYGALAAVAARTRSLRLGFGVMLLALRSPVWVAKQLATLDALAPGRVVSSRCPAGGCRWWWGDARRRPGRGRRGWPTPGWRSGSAPSGWRRAGSGSRGWPPPPAGPPRRRC